MKDTLQQMLANNKLGCFDALADIISSNKNNCDTLIVPQLLKMTCFIF